MSIYKEQYLSVIKKNFPLSVICTFNSETTQRSSHQISDTEGVSAPSCQLPSFPHKYGIFKIFSQLAHLRRIILRTLFENDFLSFHRYPRIYYCSRTHQQISQVTKELGSTVYRDTTMTILSSKDRTCINRDVATQSSVDQACQDKLRVNKIII